jgi:hypothetical protein
MKRKSTPVLKAVRKMLSGEPPEDNEGLTIVLKLIEDNYVSIDATRNKAPYIIIVRVVSNDPGKLSHETAEKAVIYVKNIMKDPQIEFYKDKVHITEFYKIIAPISFSQKQVFINEH